jgi:16S rRNA (guanine966-N2)-methyltransferase
MRITGGQRRGRVLAPLKGYRIRPTSDKVREALFSIIGQDLTGWRVLDLFAGTGSLGLEALSRGASRALFIDRAPVSITLIRENVIRCGYEDASVILRRDLGRGLPSGNDAAPEGPYDLVFMDPPYRKAFLAPLLGELGVSRMLSDGALVVVESAAEETPPETCGTLSRIRTKTYGDTKLTFYRNEVEQ